MSDGFRDDNLSRLLLSAGPVDSPESRRRLRARLHRAHHAIRLERLSRRAAVAIAFVVIVAAGLTVPVIESVTRHSPLATRHSGADWREVLRNRDMLKKALNDDFSRNGRA